MGISKEQSEERSRNARRNMLLGSIGLVLVSFFGVAERAVFINNLSQDILGVNTFLATFIKQLTLTDMTINSAMAFYLYTPLAGRDEVSLRRMLRFIQKAYRVLGSILLATGLALLPFLSILIKTPVPISTVRICYTIYLVGIVSSYFLSSESIILEADQKYYIQSITESTLRIIQYVTQMVILALTGNFLYYIIYIGASNAFDYVVLSLIAKYNYKVARKLRTAEKLDRATERRIYGELRSLSLNRIGQLVSYNITLLMLSILAGTQITGIYSNYCLVFLGLMAVTNLIFTSMNSSIGNMCSSEKKEDCIVSFIDTNCIYLILMGLIFSPLGIAFNHIIRVLYPKADVFPLYVVFMMILARYMIIGRNIVRAFEQAYGIFHQDWYKTVLEVGLNALISIVLYHFIGYSGVFLAAIISFLLSYFWLEPVCLFRYGFDGMKQGSYWFDYLRVLAVFSLNTILGLALSRYFPNSVIGVLLLFISSAISYILMTLIILAEKRNFFLKTIKRRMEKRKD